MLVLVSDQGSIRTNFGIAVMSEHADSAHVQIQLAAGGAWQSCVLRPRACRMAAHSSTSFSASLICPSVAAHAVEKPAVDIRLRSANVTGEGVSMRVCYQWYESMSGPAGGAAEAAAGASQARGRGEPEEALALAVCVRPFNPFLWGTATASVTPDQVQEWVAHHVSLGFQRLYLFDRPRAASLPTLAQARASAPPTPSTRASPLAPSLLCWCADSAVGGAVFGPRAGGFGSGSCGDAHCDDALLRPERDHLRRAEHEELHPRPASCDAALLRSGSSSAARVHACGSWGAGAAGLVGRVREGAALNMALIALRLRIRLPVSPPAPHAARPSGSA